MTVARRTSDLVFSWFSFISSTPRQIISLIEISIDVVTIVLDVTDLVMVSFLIDSTMHPIMVVSFLIRAVEVPSVGSLTPVCTYVLKVTDSDKSRLPGISVR